MNTPIDGPSHPARILIVDDERHNREVLEAMLAPEGFQFLMAVSGEEALTMVAQWSPDLILLDVMMPGMDGYEVARAVKAGAATRNIPIVMVTALDDRNARMIGLTAGAEDFLSKPIDRAELCARVRNLLRLKAFADERTEVSRLLDHYNEKLEAEVGERLAALVESEARFRQLAETIQEVFFLTDLSMNEMIYVSPAYETVFGRSCASLYAHPESWADAIHPEDRARALGEIAPQGIVVPFDVEYRIVRPDGAERFVRARGYPVKNEAGEIYRVAGLAVDVTERRLFEAQAGQTNKMEAVGRLASGVAHDFNNLLTVILGFCELLIADEALPPQHGRDLGEVIKAARRAAGLTKQLLAFGRQQVLNPAPVELNSLIADMTGMLDRLIGEDFDIALTLAPDLSLTLADRSQLEQVVMNLVVNARDAMPGGGTVRIETANVGLENSIFHEEAIVEGRYVMLSINDSGHGMSKETQRRLFEPFFTTKDAGKGTGLGLSTTYGIVKQSKGHIRVYSELGHGTTFNVYLPSTSAGTPAQNAALPPVTASAVRPFETVLLVEDQVGVRHLSKRILEKAGYRVLEAANGDEAEQLFGGHGDGIDLVVTDVIMPGCGGPELVSRLQVQMPGLRVLYMSGYAEQAVIQNTGVREGSLFLQKPFTSVDLLRRVREVLDQ